ncbi:baseplate J/gp47 family protein [Vibrio campbellii]|uniref:baseplate J/gp47 family protein n=1 Tax=Vibrio campbellii TaxID=680 RepID=UPI001F2DFE97|nr:baseplate J/gp47 family protein [Vibrio campbellii]MCE7729220.1 baseplate J/gp47 family protein [Vibrio campbellii]
MPYSTPTLKQLITQGEGDIDFYLEDSQPRLPFSVERSINFANSAMVKDLYDHQEWISRQIVPNEDSDDEYIVKHATRRGVIRKNASASLGLVSLDVTSGTTVQQGQRFQRGDGIFFKATEETTATTTTLTFNVKAESTGKITNTEAEVELIPVSTIVGATGNAVVGSEGLKGGADIESINDLLYRLQLKMQNPPQGGATFDYEQWALEVPGVTRAWAENGWQGRGTVGLTFVNDNEENIIPSQAQLDEVEAYCYQHEDPATGTVVGMPAGPELVMYQLTLKMLTPDIHLVPDSSDTRQAVRSSLKTLEVRSASPGGMLLISDIRQAIKTAAGVRDYTCSFDTDQACEKDELLSFGEITWV